MTDDPGAESSGADEAAPEVGPAPAPEPDPTEGGDGRRRRRAGARPHERPLTPAGRMLGHFDIDDEPPDRRATLEELFYEGDKRLPYLRRFGSLMVLSTAIASFGLLQNSTAVIIGAMLVAPLMTPILAVAASVVHGWFARMSLSAATILGGIVVGVATGYVISFVSGTGYTLDDLPSEILGRTTPGLLDLGVAVSAGAAGGYVLARRDASAALPGVGIAVALVPPLGTVGINLQLGLYEQSKGALLLFLTNLTAIVLSAGVMLLATGFVPEAVRAGARRQVRLGLFMSALLVVVVAVPLALHTYEVYTEQALTRSVNEAVDEWDPGARVESIDAVPLHPGASIDLTVSGAGTPQPAWRLAQILDRTWGGPIDLTVSFRPEEQDRAVSR